MKNNSDEHARKEILSQGWIKHFDWFAEIDSTSSAARRWLQNASSSEDSNLLPALFVADAQSAGRGRNDHRWWSPAGCLMLTLVIDGAILPPDPMQWSQLALVCGVAVAETVDLFVGDHGGDSVGSGVSPNGSAQLSRVQPIAQLKWPNDVYLNQRKCAGILIESAAFEKQMVAPQAKRSAWLIGIGLNVAMDWSRAPQDISTRATCLTQYSQQSIDASVVLVELVSQLRGWINDWRTEQRYWQDSWRERCFLSGRVVRAIGSAGVETIGRCEGVDAEGRLLIRHELGVDSLNSAEVVAWE